MNELIIVMAILGGLSHSLIWEDLKRFECVKFTAIGAVIGFLYMNFHSDWNFPNGVMSFVSGYMGIDFIEGLLERVKKAKP